MLGWQVQLHIALPPSFFAFFSDTSLHHYVPHEVESVLIFLYSLGDPFILFSIPGEHFFKKKKTGVVKDENER